MSNTKHSPGPWKLSSPLSGLGFSNARDVNGTLFCRVQFSGKDPEEGQHNLKLMAAAPELLAMTQELMIALNDMLSYCPDTDDYPYTDKESYDRVCKSANAAVMEARKFFL